MLVPKVPPTLKLASILEQFIKEKYKEVKYLII